MIVLQEKETAQETFDFVVEKLREQGVPSYDPVEKQCLYGKPGGIRCAVGHLMGDQECRSSSVINFLVDKKYVNEPKNLRLLRDMQNAHDGAVLDRKQHKWALSAAMRMVDVAKQNNLSPKTAQEWLDAVSS